MSWKFKRGNTTFCVEGVSEVAKISVVVPTYNRRDLLQRALESAQKQTYADIEIIVVSDGSTDGTKETVEGAAADDARIRFIELSPSRGGNAARNAGIEAATGDYVAFLDDDDKWLPEKLEKQMNYCAQLRKITSIEGSKIP